MSKVGNYGLIILTISSTVTWFYTYVNILMVSFNAPLEMCCRVIVTSLQSFIPFSTYLLLLTSAIFGHPTPKPFAC